jgi:ribose-phosphate pyrophosphokinase
LLDKSFTIDNILFVKDVLQDYSSKNPDDDKSLYSIVSPDAGALKKIYKVAAALDHIDVVECMKQRDLHTGKLSGFKVFEDDLSGRTCFIVDDICDGGGTFIGVAAELRKLGAAKIILLVSHGIFSKGYELAGIDAVYCTDSYKTISEEKINVFPVMRYLADA